MKDVERETLSVQIGTAVLPVQELVDEEEDEPSDVVDDSSLVEEDSSFSFSSSRSLPISARVSVKFSISPRSGVFPSIPSTVLVNVVTTSCAQLRSLPMSPRAPLTAFPISGSMPLSRSKALS